MDHGHHEPFKVPHYSQYNHWRSIKILRDYNERLARIGLKDPWIRNMVFKFDPKSAMIKSSLTHFLELLRPGVIPGFIFTSTVIALEEGYSFVKYGHTSWGASH